MHFKLASAKVYPEGPYGVVERAADEGAEDPNEAAILNCRGDYTKLNSDQVRTLCCRRNVAGYMRMNPDKMREALTRQDTEAAKNPPPPSWTPSQDGSGPLVPDPPQSGGGSQHSAGLATGGHSGGAGDSTRPARRIRNKPTRSEP